MKVENWDVARIQPYPGNPRQNDGAVDAVAESIKQFGFRQPIVVDAGGVIVCGHTRWKAAQKLGLKKAPVHVARDLTPEQLRAYRLVDNKTNELAEWDEDLLAIEMTALQSAGFDWTLLGFDADAVASMLEGDAKQGLTCPDEVPDPPKKPVTKPGDLWTLGEHRLLCGDSTDANDVERLMGTTKAALCATDPPYLVDYTGERPDRDGGNTGGKDWSADYREVDIKDADGFFRSTFRYVLCALAPKAPIYCWHAHKRQALIDQVWADLGILNHQQIIWVKPTAVFGRMFWHQRHEPCLMGWAKGSMPRYARNQSLELATVWEIDWEGKARVVGNEHPTQKPVEIFARPMRRHTHAGDVCYEPFCGSGSQIIAAEQLGRRCYAMEISPVFVDVAVRRWEEFTGRKAVRNAEPREKARASARAKKKGGR